MKVKVRLYGRYKDVAGSAEIELTIPDTGTIWDVVDAFITRFPEFEKDKKFVMVSKNNVFTHRDEHINKGDVITIAPPVVSGG